MPRLLSSRVLFTITMRSTTPNNRKEKMSDIVIARNGCPGRWHRVLRQTVLRILGDVTQVVLLESRLPFRSVRAEVPIRM